MSKLWSDADLHIHTSHSDGTASVRDVLEYVATQTDLRVIAITDHDTISGALEARRLASHYGIEVIVGEEISTLDGHLLALFVEQPTLPRRPAAETITAVHAQGGFCIAPHPYGMLVPSLGYHGLRERAAGNNPEWPFDAIESFNASLRLDWNNQAAHRVSTELQLPVCGGSDSHHLATIGTGRTRFPGSTAADLRVALQQRQTQAVGNAWGIFRNLELLALMAGMRAQRVLRRA